MERQIVNLKDLMIEQIRELYNAEKQQKTALSQMQDKAASRELKKAIKDHIDETAQQIKRLEDIFQQLKISSFGERSEAMHALVQEGNELIERSSDPEVLDAALIASIQYMEHFEIAGYGSACTYANELELEDIADQLYLSMVEEKEFDEQLSEIAMEQINGKAKAPVVL